MIPWCVYPYLFFLCLYRQIVTQIYNKFYFTFENFRKVFMCLYGYLMLILLFYFFKLLGYYDIRRGPYQYWFYILLIIIWHRCQTTVKTILWYISTTICLQKKILHWSPFHVVKTLCTSHLFKKYSKKYRNHELWLNKLYPDRKVLTFIDKIN